MGRCARSVPLSPNESRCSPLWRALRAIAMQSGYPRFARLANGRGSAAFGAAVVRRLRSGLSGTRIALQTPPRGPLRAASPLPSATYPPLRSGAFRQRPSCERSPPFIPTWALAFGAAALVRALLVLKLPLRVPSGAAFICASRSSNDCPWDSQPRPRRVGCPSFAFDCAFSSPRRGGRLLRCVRLP